MKLLHKLPVPFLRIWNHHSDSEKNSLPGYISPEQLIFLKKIRHHRQFVFTARILLLILFLLQWELCANAGIVDSFIFSSPSRIARCFWEMTLDQYRDHTLRDACQFCLRYAVQPPGRCTFMEQSKTF